VRLFYGFVTLLRNNSSLMAVPATSFCIYLVIAARSHLPADDLYFFLSAAFALCAVLDGGLPYRLAPGAGNPGSLIRVCRRVQTNMLQAAPFIGLALVALIWLSPFAAKSSPPEVLAYAGLGLGITLMKALTDTARVASLKSVHRVVTDQVTSAFGLLRLIAVLAIAGKVPYLPIFAISLLAELICIARVNSVAPWALARKPRSVWRRRFRCDRSYLKANLAYNMAFNIDRLVAFYFLAPSPYRALVGITSLCNMAILPHKLVENELLFPSTTRKHSHFTHTVVPAIFCGAGCAGLVIAFHLLGGKLGTDITAITSVAAAVWVTITAYYNRLWSISLRDFKIAFLAQVNLAASAAALVAAFLGHEVYGHFIPAGLAAYSIVNFAGLLAGRLAHKADLMIYVVAAAAGTALSFGALPFL
jgi:hypothetical protein